MVMPVIFAITTLLNFDPIWFGVIMSINMEIGLITPPVGLNLNVVKGIAPNIPLRDTLAGSLPYVVILARAIVLFSAVPDVITGAGRLGPDELVRRFGVRDRPLPRVRSRSGGQAIG